jgi:hypothetical protein
LAFPKGIPELSPSAPEEVRQTVPTISVVRQYGSELCPIGFDGQQVLGHAPFTNIGRTEDKVTNRSLIRDKRMEPKAEEKLPF